MASGKVPGATFLGQALPGGLFAEQHQKTASFDALVGHYTHQGVKGLGQAIESAMSGTACSTVSITLVSYSTHCV